MNQSNDVDQYIAGFQEQTRIMLQQIREIIRKAAPEAEEVISYQMPAYRMKRILVYFAAFKKHIGFYPTSSGIEAFKSEFAGYKWSKGAVQFPLDQPLPAELITKIVKFRVEENSKK